MTAVLQEYFDQKYGFAVEILTRYGRGRKSPVVIDSLTCAAEALSYQEYLVEDTSEVVALYGPGVLVRIPTPVKYAVHKLLIAQRRKPHDPKKQKDLMQARELLDILIETDEAAWPKKPLGADAPKAIARRGPCSRS